MKLLNLSYSRPFLQLSLFGGILIAIVFIVTQYISIDETRITFSSSHPIRKHFWISGIRERQKSVQSLPVILLWTTLYSEINWAPSLSNLNCPMDCQVTSNRKLLNDSAAVVFHLRSVDIHNLPPWTQNSSRKWVLYNREAPPNTEISVIRALEGKIHWTATYRHDSDFYAPYSTLVPTNETQTPAGLDKVEKKSHLVCWIVSHCRTSSRREAYVRILNKYIPVAVYGRCGSSACPEGSAEHCYQHVSKSCKFYLSFENSICTEYVTEKLFNALQTDMIPIVMGGGDYSHMLPNHSYINIVDFINPKALAKYLLELNNDPEKFKAYHTWKTKYQVLKQDFSWICDLCQKLHRDSRAFVNTYKNLTSWWFNQKCPSWIKIVRYH